jgi:hypothetical protein
MTPAHFGSDVGQAVRYPGIGYDGFMQSAQKGKIQGYKYKESRRGDWYFNRISLDSFHEHQIQQ